MIRDVNYRASTVQRLTRDEFSFFARTLASLIALRWKFIAFCEIYASVSSFLYFLELRYSLFISSILCSLFFWNYLKVTCFM